MGNYWTTRRSSGVEEINLTQQYQYRYPPRDGSNYFASHFIMGGERFDMPQAEGYLFGENSDLNFLGSRPAPFPYSAPQSHEPTKTLNALINVRKESLRFVKIQLQEQSAQTPGMENEDGVGSCSSPDLTSSMISAGKTATVLDAVATGPPSLPSGTSTSNSNFLYCSSSTQDVSAASSNKKIKSIDKKGASTSSTSLLQNTNGGTASSVLSSPVSNKKKSSSIQIPQPPPPTPAPNNTKFNIEFTFDADAKCAITIHYFCIEELSPYGVFYTPRDHRMSSETYRFKKGANQVFSQATHIFDPTEWPEEDLSLSMEMKEVFPVVIHCIAEEGEEPRQSHSTIAVVEKVSDGYALKPVKQKIFVDGLVYLLQEIYGIENKNSPKRKVDDDPEDSGYDCVICMSDPRDTLILPCRHLCLCYLCADSLRYQASNCPICRAPFRALLQIRAVQKGETSTSTCSEPTSSSHQPASTTASSTRVNIPQIPAGVESPPSQQGIPTGYEVVSLLEALNGPPPTPPPTPSFSASKPRRRSGTSYNPRDFATVAEIDRAVKESREWEKKYARGLVDDLVPPPGMVQLFESEVKRNPGVAVSPHPPSPGSSSPLPSTSSGAGASDPGPSHRHHRRQVGAPGEAHRVGHPNKEPHRKKPRSKASGAKKSRTNRERERGADDRQADVELVSATAAPVEAEDSMLASAEEGRAEEATPNGFCTSNGSSSSASSNQGLLRVVVASPPRTIPSDASGKRKGIAL